MTDWMYSQLLLGYLSPSKAEWNSTLSKKRQIYRQFVEELILTDPTSQQHDDHVSSWIDSLDLTLQFISHWILPRRVSGTSTSKTTKCCCRYSKMFVDCIQISLFSNKKSARISQQVLEQSVTQQVRSVLEQSVTLQVRSVLEQSIQATRLQSHLLSINQLVT